MRVGRNDPCPCGSGEKFKKCHGAVITLQASGALFFYEQRGERLW